MNFKSSLIFIVMCIAFFKAHAYVPSPEMVLSRLERTQGRGWYKITQKLTFLENFKLKESFSLNEVWWRGPNQAFVQVTSSQYPDLKLQFSYKNFSKSWMNTDKKRIYKTQNHIETYFIPQVQFPKWLQDITQLRLGRAVGVVSYIFNSKQNTLWVEQDEFVIRQMRQGSDFILKLFDYQAFSRGFRFPKRREFITSEYKVIFDLGEVQPLSQKKDNQLTPNQWGTSLQSVELVKEFYQSFR